MILSFLLSRFYPNLDLLIGSSNNSNEELQKSKLINCLSNYCNNRRKRNLITFDRSQRGILNQFEKDDLFLPVRGRREALEQDSTHVSTKKNPKLDTMQDLFVPNRGRRQLVRKNFPFQLEPYPMISLQKRRNIELDNMNDFFVPHRGKRERTINDILSDNFLPQRGKKAFDEILSDSFFPQRGKKSSGSIIVPKFHIPVEPQSLQNINSYDRQLIDRQLHDLNLLLMNISEVRRTLLN